MPATSGLLSSSGGGGRATLDRCGTGNLDGPTGGRTRQPAKCAEEVSGDWRDGCGGGPGAVRGTMAVLVGAGASVRGTGLGGRSAVGRAFGGAGGTAVQRAQRSGRAG